MGRTDVGTAEAKVVQQLATLLHEQDQVRVARLRLSFSSRSDPNPSSEDGH